MIKTEFINIKICPSNYKYWMNKGYIDSSTKVGGRAGINGVTKLNVKVQDLTKNSNVRVECICDKCESSFTNRICRYTDICYPCRKILIATGNSWGSANKGKSLPNMKGENHPFWRSDKTDFELYCYNVTKYTHESYSLYKHEINPNNLPRTLCGVEGGYQLDHIISMTEGYARGILPIIIGDKSNLQMLKWEDNLAKRTTKYSRQCSSLQE